MADIVKESVRIITKGTIIVFLGTVLGIVFTAVSKIIIARYGTPSEYGSFSLALSLLSIGVVIATLGFRQGVARQVAYYRGKKDPSKVKGIILSAVQISTITSIILSVIIFCISDIISSEIFHNPELSTYIKIISIAIPFLTLIYILVSIFRGFERVNAKVYFQDISMNVVFLILLTPVILLGLSFTNVFYAFLLSLILTSIAFVAYTLKRLPELRTVTAVNPMRKALVIFSLPLLGYSMLGSIMSWTDTLMIGYFKDSFAVGLYNAALPLAVLIGIFISSTVFFYTPIITKLYSQNLITEMKRTYAVLTKWVFMIVMPVFLVLFFFPDIFIEFLFGSQYVVASTALRILSLGYAVQAFLGFTGSTLTAMGKTRALLLTSVVTVSFNVLLNALLIPKMGINGAAVASAVSLSLTVIILLIRVYQISGIHPFTRNYLKPILASVSIIAIIYLITNNIVVTWWMLPIFFILFLVVYGASLLFTRSFDDDDLMMLTEIEKILGLKLEKLKMIIKKFT